MNYVGTCSWTDSTLIGESGFYPAKTMSAEERLRFYASKFNTVEVDSPFYALPSEAVVALQTARTPADFKLNYKAYGMLTTHSVETRSLPKAMRDIFPASLLDKPRLSYSDVPEEARSLAFRMFSSALKPAAAAGKLGCVVFQFPPWFSYGSKSLGHVERCRDELPEYELAIEFRNPGWLDSERRAETMRFLSERSLAYVSVDEPQFDEPKTVPPIFEATTGTAYVRLHGRNKEAWFKKGLTAAERFAYDYSQGELFEIAGRIKPLAKSADKTFVMFNNCFRDYAVNNAMIMSEILKD